MPCSITTPHPTHSSPARWLARRRRATTRSADSRATRARRRETMSSRSTESGEPAMADLTVGAETCVALGATGHQFESFPGRDIALGPLTVTRVLPVKGKRLVGPWCFLDRFGPLTFVDPAPMDVGAHPHMGLQTVTWLLDGEIVHYDSLGYESLLRPGGVNVMTSGAAIAHAERTPARNSGRLNGAQLWVALPERDRHMSALFQHVDRVPLDEQRGGIVQVFAGSLGTVASPATD